MKKYKPTKAYIIFIIAIVFSILDCIVFPDVEGVIRILLIICTITVVLVLIIAIGNFVQFNDDEAIIRYAIKSDNKAYRSIIKTRHILYSDVENITTNYRGQYVIIRLKNGVNLSISLLGFFRSRSDEMLKEFDKINEKIHSEQEN